jgi:nucleoside-diphosphate-sugar epimerase
MFALVVRSKAAIQALENPGRNPTASAQKTMRYPAQYIGLQDIYLRSTFYHAYSFAGPGELGNMLDARSAMADGRAMTGAMVIFGMGYTASRLARRLKAQGWSVVGIRRMSHGDCIAFDDRAAILTALGCASHILSSVPPKAEGGDPVLEQYGLDIAASGARWIGYLSSTGVYGDTGGAWVDETAPSARGRRLARADADLEWQAMGHVFRLPGIYGPHRSALERVREARAHRIDLPDQIFSRVHVDDIVSGVIASFAGPAGIYNLADDFPCSQNEVIEHACALLGLPQPPLQSLDQAALTPMARAFYGENRRISNRKAKRLLGWKPFYPSYKQGLAALLHS